MFQFPGLLFYQLFVSSFRLDTENNANFDVVSSKRGSKEGTFGKKSISIVKKKGLYCNVCLLLTATS